MKRDENLSKKTKSKTNLKKKSKLAEIFKSPEKKDKVDVPNLIDSETPQVKKKKSKKTMKTEPNLESESTNNLKMQTKDYAQPSYGTEKLIDPSAVKTN